MTLLVVVISVVSVGMGGVGKVPLLPTHMIISLVLYHFTKRHKFRPVKTESIHSRQINLLEPVVYLTDP